MTWDRLTAEHFEQVAQYGSRPGSAAETAASALLIGYTTFVEAAACAPRLLIAVDCGVIAMPQEQLRACVSLMADAAELIIQPRSIPLVALSVEGGFTKCMRELVRRPGCILRHGALGERLLDSWRRLEQSGVLEERRADVAMQSNIAFAHASGSATAAAAAAPGLRRCALAACGAREAHPSHFKSCAACRGVAYCCKEHQTQDWPSHKAACKAARKAAERTAERGASS